MQQFPDVSEICLGVRRLLPSFFQPGNTYCWACDACHETALVMSRSLMDWMRLTVFVVTPWARSRGFQAKVRTRLGL